LDAGPGAAGRAEQGRWIAEPAWPSECIQPLRLNLNPGRLGPEPEPEVALSHCSSQLIGSASGSWCPYGRGDLPGDQRIDDGPSLVFDTLPLVEGIELLGAAVLELEMAVDRPLAVLVARLCDVDTAGASSRVTYGALNLTHRLSDAEPEPMIAGERMRIRLQLSNIAHAFAPGHRVRLALSTSYWPIVWPSPAPTTLTMFTGRACTLTLPLRPPCYGDRDLLPLGEPEGTAGPPMTSLEPGRASSIWRFDLDADTAELVGAFDSGLERFDDIGTAAGMAIRSRSQSPPMIRCQQLPLSAGSFAASVPAGTFALRPRSS
jgi:hypothetical protein